MTRHSDVDLLVVKDGVDPLDAMGWIYGNLYGVGAAVDAIVVSPSSLERYRDCPRSGLQTRIDGGQGHL